MEDKTKQAAEAAGRMHQAYADINTLKHIKFLIEEMRRMHQQINGSITLLHDSHSASRLREEAGKIETNASSLDLEIEEAEKKANSTAFANGSELYSLI